MPLQNRVTPFGEIVVSSARGTLMGNRGILHGPGRALGVARWRHPHWVACRLAFKGHWRPVMTEGAYTELFFLDEAVALAAGHRPCAYCRRRDFDAFVTAWTAAQGLGERPRAPALDRQLHRARVGSRTRRQLCYAAPIATLPDGVLVVLPDDPATAWLVTGHRLLPWNGDRYGTARTRPGSGEVTVLTPGPTVAALSAGYVAALHPTAGPAVGRDHD